MGKINYDQRISTCQQLAEYLSQLKSLKGKCIKAPGDGAVTVGSYFPRQGCSNRYP